MSRLVNVVNRYNFEVKEVELRESIVYRKSSDWLFEPLGLAALIAAGVPKYYWKVVVNDLVEMSPAEKAVAFPTAKNIKNDAFALQTLRFISDSGYDPPAQTFLTALLADAYGTSKTNRAAYITQALNWIAQAHGLYIIARDAANAATSDMELNAVTLDLTPLTATDPHVTTEGALSIPD